MILKIVTLLVSNIQWDTEGESLEDCNLPDFIVIQDFFCEDGNVSTEKVQILVSDSFGFNLHSLEWKQISEENTRTGIVMEHNMAYLNAMIFEPDYKHKTPA